LCRSWDQIHQFDSLRFGHVDAVTRAAEQSQVGGYGQSSLPTKGSPCSSRSA